MILILSLDILYLECE